MNRREEIEAERRRAAAEALARVRREAETIGESGLARAAGPTAKRLKDHFAAGDADPDDAIEIWGRRIARLIALAAVAGLFYHLTSTYLPQ